ncbi:immune inhibitor A domain-containing protein [Streptomyces sp. NPDC047976]|uniref:immune inhibitor A domain-containing protein n=1 Tax=Streptomyces sp. NPDC047976 TaxID=3155746 RepID=UPI00343C0BB0
MRRLALASAGAAISLAALALLPSPAALAATAPPPAPPAGQAEQAASPPLAPPELQRQALRRQALEHIAAGDSGASPSASADATARTAGPLPRTAKIGSQYVELAQRRKDKVFVILAEFGDRTDPRFGGTPGPLHNTIGKPAPDDNHTLWRKDFDKGYYQQQFFSPTPGSASMRAYYNLQSSGRYDIDGKVTDWVKLPYNEARYGTDQCTEPGQCRTNWDLVRDSTTAWYESERAKGRTPAEIKSELAQYDVWDRYDADHDGNFDEPDGYLDHLVVVHAGKDQTWGGGAQGKDAIWAHRWFAYWNQAGSAGPEGNKAGGTPVGDTGIWAGDYLTGGENSGAGLFSHEFGHDLGLPDLYSSDGDNGVNFWSLMSSASYLGKGPNTTGQFPGDLDPWSKLQLGWLDYTEADAGRRTRATLGVSGYHTDDPQALLVHLPPSTTRTELTDPYEGARQWWSGTGDFMDNTLTRPLDPTAGPATLTARVQYDLEQDFDFLTAEASADGGKTWTPLPATLDGTPIPPKGISGTSRSWSELTVPLPTPSTHLRLRTTSDGNTHGRGVTLDDIRITAADGRTLLQDGAEQGDNGWTPLKWSRTEGRTGTTEHPRAYFAENRRHTGYGSFLKTGPYNFTSTDQQVEFYPYQQGVLLWLWDTAYSENTTKAHPGNGLILPVDARPAPLRFPDGSLLNARAQTFDAPFSTRPTDRITLHKPGTSLTVPSRPGVRVFDDHRDTYWTADLPQLGVKVPDTGTRIEITKETPTRTTLQLTPSP